MDPALATDLLESIAAERLVVLCGAGLSIPSGLPSALDIARACRGKYREMMGCDLDPTLRDDIEVIARHFFAQSNFDSMFIGRLIPWASFNRPPNVGHEALADLLACKAVPTVVTTNFDTLCESAATQLGEPDFRAIVDTVDLPRPSEHGSLLKLHGCATRSRASTVWCSEQLAQPPMYDRFQRFRTWMAEKLLGKDLLLIGFWSDWAYLSELFVANITAVGPRSVYIVNPDTADELERKAPQLWAWANGPGIQFHHVAVSGDAFLDDLRKTWSARFVWRLMDAASPTYETFFGPAPTAPADLRTAHSSRILYALRRDLTGTPSMTPVRDRTPSNSDHVAAAIHRRLLDNGAILEPHAYRFAGRTVRVISGKGRLLSVVRAAYQHEPPPVVEPDEIVCAGAVDDPTAPHIVRGASSGSIVRPGSRAPWTTHAQLVSTLRGPHE